MPLQRDAALNQRLGHLELLAREAVEGFITGLHKSPFHGFSVEFAEHRMYNPGESTRHLDWKLYARTDRLYVKRYEEETNLRCQLVIDRSPSMAYPPPTTREEGSATKLGFSVHAAAALMEMLKRQRDAVGLSTYGNGEDLHLPARSSAAHARAVVHRLDEVLDAAPLPPAPGRTTETAAALHRVAEVCPQRSLVCVFSDFLGDPGGLDALLGALQHLRHNKHEVILFHVLDASTEVDFAFENRPTRFADLETGEEVRLFPGEAQTMYTDAMARMRADFELKCAQYRVDWVDVDRAQGVYPILSAYLVRRTRMQAGRRTP